MGVGQRQCKPSGDTTQRSCLQFFEVLTGGASPVVNQDFSFGTKNFYDYYPSVDLDSSDDLITSFSQSSSTEFPSAFVDGRLAGDPVNTLGTPVLFQAGANSVQRHDDGAIIRAPALIPAIRLRFGSRRNRDQLGVA